MPHAPGVLPRIHIPILADLPVVGQIFDQQPIVLSAILLVVLTHWVIFFTRWGLRMRSVGENPLAADTVGIDVYQTRYRNVLIGGLIAGLGSAYFTLESVPSFEPGQTAGRGFIALAAMIFGNWRPGSCSSAATPPRTGFALAIPLQREGGTAVPSTYPHASRCAPRPRGPRRTLDPAARPVGRPYVKQ